MSRVVFIIDPLNKLNLKKDSTLAMMWAAQRKGWSVYVAEINDLVWQQGKTWINATPIQLPCSPDQLAQEETTPSLATAEPSTEMASSFNAVFMRKDPPFNMDYINATYFLEQLEQEGTLIFNAPQALRDCNEKFYTTSFPDLIPPQIVASDPDLLRAFQEEHGDVVFKPLDGMGGKGIFRAAAGDPNTGVILETLTNYGSTTIVGQKFIPEIKDGDKRLLLINGEPVPFTLARIPQHGESRGNLAVGGIGEPRPLTERDRYLANAVAPDLIKRNLIFVGLDVIGDYLTEINVTCPTCIRELDKACDLDIAFDLMSFVEQQI